MWFEGIVAALLSELGAERPFVVDFISNGVSVIDGWSNKSGKL
jgi:hypothetical protein